MKKEKKIMKIESIAFIFQNVHRYLNQKIIALRNKLLLEFIIKAYIARNLMSMNFLLPLHYTHKHLIQ